MKIEEVATRSLKPMPGNPRVITQQEMRALRRSIRAFGMPDPIIVHKESGQIIGGHQRWLAAKQLGWAKVPVVYWTGPYKKARALNLALNRIAGDWDYGLLRTFLDDLRRSDIDIKITGFTDSELDALTKPMERAYVLDLAPGISKIVDVPVDVDSSADTEQISKKSTSQRKVTCPKCGTKFAP